MGGSGENHGVGLRLAAAEREAVVRMLMYAREVLDPEHVQPREEPSDPLDALVQQFHEPHEREPDDPALARLLPTASRDDPEAAAEYRRLVEPGLRARKITAIDRAVRTVSEGGSAGITAATGSSSTLLLTQEDAVTLTVALNDVRLVLGERLDLREDDDEVARVRGLAADVMRQVPRGTGLAKPGGRTKRLGSRFDVMALYLDQLAHRLAAARASGIEVDEQTRMRVSLSVHYRFLTWLQDELAERLLDRR